MERWITLSHSARPLDFSRSSRAFLLERFNQGARLENLPPFLSLGRAGAPQWANNITVWIWCDTREELRLLAFIRRGYTVNHGYVDVERERLVICGHDRLEICDPRGSIRSKVSHPWFAGGHTVHANHLGSYIVACSASDAVLTVDAASLVLKDAWRIPPSLYEENYSLTTSADVRAHYIPTDLQISHLNCATPTPRYVLLTCFIQGSIVKVLPDSTTSELTTGYVGCHGARLAADGRIYFADSPQGRLVWLDAVGARLATLSLRTEWLHDAVELSENLYACAIGDRNELCVVNVWDGTTVCSRPLEMYGATPCLLGTGVL